MFNLSNVNTDLVFDAARHAEVDPQSLFRAFQYVIDRSAKPVNPTVTVTSTVSVSEHEPEPAQPHFLIGFDRGLFFQAARKYAEGETATSREICHGMGMEFRAKARLGLSLQSMGWIHTGQKRGGCCVYLKPFRGVRRG